MELRQVYICLKSSSICLRTCTTSLYKLKIYSYNRHTFSFSLSFLSLFTSMIHSFSFHCFIQFWTVFSHSSVNQLKYSINNLSIAAAARKCVLITVCTKPITYFYFAEFSQLLLQLFISKICCNFYSHKFIVSVGRCLQSFFQSGYALRTT